MARALWLVAMALGLWAAAPARADEVTLFNTYLSPPYVLQEGGLAADTTAYLNKQLAGRFVLRLVNMQRSRLRGTVLDSSDFNGAVLFVNPAFVDDAAMQRYRWTEPVMRDTNVVVSPVRQPFHYEGLESFDGKTFLAITGSRYVGLEERFGKSVHRVDGTSEMHILRRMVEGPGDVTVISRGVATWLSREPDLAGKLVIDEKPFATFNRHILVAPRNPELAAALEKVVKAMPSDPAWRAVLARYGF